MIKVMMLVKRKPGISKEEFYNYWQNVHGPLVAKSAPKLRKYIQNHFVEMPGQEYEGDGIIEMWYDDMESWQQPRDIDKTKADPLMADWAKIADMSPPKIWVVEEHVIKDET
jgi:uncharacterized protein (TIGR02118 family)